MMTQSTPPGDQRSGNNESLGNEDHAQGRDEGYREGPYASRMHADDADLDAGAPVLRSSEVQRLNRKALVFLAGIVALLVVAIVFSFMKLGGEDEVPVVRQEAPQIPDAPTPTRAPTLPTEPIEVQPLPEPPILPPSDSEIADDRALPREPARDMGPSLMDRRMLDAAANSAGGDTSGSPLANDPVAQALLANMNAQNGQQAASAQVEKATSAQFIRNPDVLMVRGTYIRCVLETRIVTDIPGFTSCIVTEPVYSINGRSLLLPRGSKVLGSYDYEPKGPRVAVVWDRITTPNGIDVSMRSPGVDNLGGAGHEARYTAHWGSRITSAILISLISDAFKYAAAENGPPTSTVGAGGVVVQQPYESATARSVERLANQALDNRRPPTAIINQGTVVNVYVAQDVDFAGVVSKF